MNQLPKFIVAKVILLCLLWMASGVGLGMLIQRRLAPVVEVKGRISAEEANRVNKPGRYLLTVEECRGLRDFLDFAVKSVEKHPEANRALIELRINPVDQDQDQPKIPADDRKPAPIADEHVLYSCLPLLQSAGASFRPCDLARDAEGALAVR